MAEPKAEFHAEDFKVKLIFAKKRDERTYVMNEIGGNSPFIRFHRYV